MIKIERTPAGEIPRDLLLLADEDEEMIARYLGTALFWAARDDNGIVGMVGLKEQAEGLCEIVCVAVYPEYQNQKIGTRLVEAAVGYAKTSNYREVLIKTGDCGIGQLYLYQRCGFRFKAIVKDYFVKYYKQPIYENDLRCIDQIVLSYRVYSKEEQERAVEEYWARFIEKKPAYRDRSYETWCFCYGDYLPDKLIGLVKQGKKTGTSSALELYEGGEKIPEEGDVSVITYGNGLPGCIIETKECRVLSFSEVTEEEAALEGEGDLTLAYWREVHEEVFSREYEAAGRRFSLDIPVIFERFEVVYDEDDRS